MLSTHRKSRADEEKNRAPPELVGLTTAESVVGRRAMKVAKMIADRPWIWQT